MPSGPGWALIGLGAVVTSMSAVAGSAVAAAGVLWEVVVFYLGGR